MLFVKSKLKYSLLEDVYINIAVEKSMNLTGIERYSLEGKDEYIKCMCKYI
jgi:CRISPR/Cas system CMR-associated protein Cmr3 (group 5 of RAMP superfamily)